MSNTDESVIQELILNWTKAIATGDRQTILAHHARDVLMFDFPNTVSGIDAYDKTWQFFDDSRRGQVIFEPRDVKVTAGDDVAFASCEIHCEGTTAGPIDLRLTVGLERRGGEWLITHEHHSMPTTDETLIGPDVRKAETADA